MGDCPKYPLPVSVNQCSTGVSQEFIIPNFCAIEGPAGNSWRTSFCENASISGEWIFKEEGNPNTCQFNSCKDSQEFPGSCCGGCCPISGATAICERVKFTGDPITCCFNDLVCSGKSPSTNPVKCYSDGENRQNTCDDGSGGNNYRSITSRGCQDIMTQYCTGTLPTDPPPEANSIAWLDRWDQGRGIKEQTCNEVIARNLFRTSSPCGEAIPPLVPGQCNIPPVLEIDSEGYFWAQSLITAAISRYEEQGLSIGALPGEANYNPWAEFLYANICCPYPGLCQSALTKACETNTAQRISLNPAISQWCGCHLPIGEYEDYSVKFNIPPECTPMCNRTGTVPIVGVNAEPVLCKQDICLIDGITVNLINSQVGGGIDFNQICGNCGVNASCSCVVSNTTIDINNSTIGGNVVPVSQGCGSVSCSETNPGGTGPNVISTKCDGGNPYSQYDQNVANSEAEGTKRAWLVTLIVVAICLGLLYLIIFIIPPPPVEK